MSRIVFSCLAVLGIVIATAASADPASGKLVAHEWGTFTGLAGSDGTHLPFMSVVGSELPGFVLTRSEQHRRLDPAGAAALFDLTKGELVALQRMETPVVYFYTDAPRDVEARVEFPQGLLTEFYPPVRAMTPPYRTSRPDVMKESSLDWGKFRIIPGDAGRNVLAVENKSPYVHARATDSALVQFAGKPGEVIEEKFLFYRGLGNFSLPVALAAVGGDRFVLYNSSPDPIGHAFLIRIEKGGGRFTELRNVRGRLEAELPREASDLSGLGDAVAKALVAEGLYEKEARAMVKTWEASWFGEEGTGTRLLYTLPRPATEAVLPLKITPAPDELVRVLVGRIDVLTPEQESRLAAMLTRVDGAAAISPQEAREAKALGRFLMPAVQRAASVQAGRLYQAVRAVHD